MAPQSLFKLGIIGATLIIQVLLNIVLGVLMWRKRRFQASSPIQSSLASARRHTKQLNRINLIAFIMSLQYLLTNLPMLVAPSIYWRSLQLNLIDFGTLKLIVKSIDLLALFLVASRAFLVCLASPKIRKEAWWALRCKQDSDNIKQFSIDIKPRQEKDFDINPDVLLKQNSMEKHNDK